MMQKSTIQASVVATATSVGKSMIRSRAVGSLSVAATTSSFRIVSYHGVPDPALFAAHLDYYAAEWTPVSGTDVLSSLTGGAPLPQNALWVTFDDGEASVVRHALSSLVERGIPATLYVCPGLVEQKLPYWWRIIDEAIARSTLPADLAERREPVTFLKTVDDRTRRGLVDATWSLLSHEIRSSLVAEVASIEELRRWHDSGLEIGNHSWDHPLLNKIDTHAQRDQVVSADAWLTNNGFETHNFAYPNGNHLGADGAAAALKELGYRIVVHHDHRLTKRDSNPLALSRLKVESVDSVDRLASIVTGTQPALRHFVDTVTR